MALMISSTDHDKHTESERIQFTDLSDEEILKFVNEKFSPSDDFDVAGLFKITETIIDLATHNSIVDNILQPANAQNEKIPIVDVEINWPKCILQAIYCVLHECFGIGSSEKETSIPTRTEAIFDKLKPYSWEAKAVLSLAAFSLEYGDLWHLAQLYGQRDQLTNSVAILKRVPILLNKATLENRKNEVSELNHLIKATLQVTDLICKVEDLFKHYHPKDVPTLTTAGESIPTSVFWTITTIAACAVNAKHLICVEEKPFQLSFLVTKIKGILEILEKQHARCLKEIEVVKNCNKLCRKIQNSEDTHKISEVVKALIGFKDDGNLPVISFGINVKEEVPVETFVDEVKENNVLLYISSLENIPDDDISRLNKIQDEAEKDNKKWKIVWIPTVEEWKKKQIKQFEEWGARISCYKVQIFSPAVFRFFKEEWSYKGNALIVALNSEGKLQNTDVLPSWIKKSGIISAVNN